MLYLDIAREYIPAPKANFVRVVINGESWGMYVNQQTFSKEFVQRSIQDDEGHALEVAEQLRRRRVLLSGRRHRTLSRWYEMKGEDDPDAWRELIQATKVLKETPADQLEAALAPIMDVDDVLRFLALDVALVNNDGYWRDGSDFNLTARATADSSSCRTT